MNDESFEQNFVWYEWTFVDPGTAQDEMANQAEDCAPAVSDRDDVWRWTA